jgi:membrane protease subunit (stomatin/prohibitin family)
MKKQTLTNILAVVLIFSLIGMATIGEVGEQMANPKIQKTVTQDTIFCPDCGVPNCIYKEINENCGDGTDTDVQKAVLKVCKKRKITNPKTIDTLLKEYYL